MEDPNIQKSPQGLKTGPGAPRLAVVLLGVFLALAGCGRDEPTRQEPIAPGEVPRQILENATMRQMSVRGLLWVLEADRALSYDDDQPTRLEAMTIRFYDGGTSVRSTLTSLRGWVDSETRELVAEDSVVVVTAEGDRLETERLQWDPKSERVRTELPFTLYRRADVVTGIGIDADPDLGSYTVHKELRAVVRDAPTLEEIDADEPD